MEGLIIFLVISLGPLLALIVGLSLVLKSSKESDPEFDIIQLSDGRYAPKLGEKYLYIGFGKTADLISFSGHLNTFRLKEDALDYMERWKTYRGIGAISVGLKLDK